MSNTQVGNVYQQIIADVVESSRVDFEEGGVDEHVLEELRQGWQQKLSQLNVATFPWDPKPEPAPVIANPPTVPSNTGSYQQPLSTPPISQSQPSAPSIPATNSNSNGPRIKAEPGEESQQVTQPPYNPLVGMTNATPAAQRAAQHLQASYGNRAAASIDAIRTGVTPQSQNSQQNIQQGLQQQQNLQQRASGPTARPQMTQEQYRAMQASQAQQQMRSLNDVNGAQTDGAGDDKEASIGVIKRYNTQGEEEEMGRIEIDNIIRNKVESMGLAMEGGGLMLPLHQAAGSGKRRQRKAAKLPLSGLVPQHDGGDDDYDDEKSNVLKDEDLDEDAINSDLDDPDDGLNEEEDDDDSMGHIMLCMYDKVQRVKNKWKCVMKDGVLTVNGREYVFHKASGEYEW